MSGPKIAAALFGAALLLTVAFQHATQVVLGPPMQEAIGNVDALAAAQAASTSEDPPKERAEHRRRAVSSDAPPRKGWQANEAGWSVY